MAGGHLHISYAIHQVVWRAFMLREKCFMGKKRPPQDGMGGGRSHVKTISSTLLLVLSLLLLRYYP